MPRPTLLAAVDWLKKMYVLSARCWYYCYSHLSNCSDLAGQVKQNGVFLCSDVRRLALRASVARQLGSASDWPDDLAADAACVTGHGVFFF